MKQTLSDLYETVLLKESEKFNLQNPSQDEVGKLKPKQNIFGTEPKPVEGPDKAKLKQGPSYKETTGSTSKPSATKSSMPNSAPAKEAKTEEAEEVEGTKAEPEEKEEKKEKKKEINKESFTMSAFETLFKKTLIEELDEVTEPAPDMEAEEGLDMDMDEEAIDDEEEGLQEEEADLISDLRDLQDRLSTILSKLEGVQDEQNEVEAEEEGYSEEDFDDEFGEEEGEEMESSVKESMDKPKALNNSKGKGLMNKKNKVGRLNPKGGKAHGGSLKNEPKPKALGDRKGSLQKGKPEVKSTIKKGDFIK
jgi:hypothetical protein